MINCAMYKNLKFDIKEDTLTSSVFGNLLHLPAELFWLIIRDSCSTDLLPRSCGKIESFEFWPHWDSEGTSNSRFVEPDLFIRFEEFDLIIEAKRWDIEQQNGYQWESQLKAYCNEYLLEDMKPKLFYLAVGGNLKISSVEKLIQDEKGLNFKVIVEKLKWRGILNSVINCEKSLKQSKGLIHSIDSILRIIDTVIIGFRLHGFSTGKWFEKFETFKINNHTVLDLWLFEK